MNPLTFQESFSNRLKQLIGRLRQYQLHFDTPLFVLLLLLAIGGLFILFSASNESYGVLHRQMWRLLLGFIMMTLLAQIPPKYYYEWAPWIFFGALFLLLMVLLIGKIDKGAKRWIALGFIQLQPSEVMKIAAPLVLARFLTNKVLPLRLFPLCIAFILLGFPVLLTMKQPDLGTAIIIAVSGLCVLLLAGLSWKHIALLVASIGGGAPILWHFMHSYQKERLLTFLNPERDPLGSGYHIIQSKIAIGSGGFLGKGWLHGTQSHLQFLPAHATDFIFAVHGEELGWLGCTLLILLYFFIFMRCLIIAMNSQNNFTRLLAGSLSLTFIFCTFVNIGMVIGILPVVGIPLPLISFGGSSIVMTMIGFGIIMSIQNHRPLWIS